VGIFQSFPKALPVRSPDEVHLTPGFCGDTASRPGASRGVNNRILLRLTDWSSRCTGMLGPVCSSLNGGFSWSTGIAQVLNLLFVLHRLFADTKISSAKHTMQQVLPVGQNQVSRTVHVADYGPRSLRLPSDNSSANYYHGSGQALDRDCYQQKGC